MSADTRLKALREKTSGSNDNFDNRIAALRSTPASTSGNPVDLLPKPQGNGYVSMADLNRQSNGSGTRVSLAGARGSFRNNYGYGNLDLTDRPIYVNPDGSYSTVRSLSVGFDDDTVLIPTVGWDANRNPVSWTEDEAIQHYLQTGEHLGKFATQEAADQYGQWLHEQQEAYYNNNPTVVALRDRQKNGKSTVAPGTPGGGGRGVTPTDVKTGWDYVGSMQREVGEALANSPVGVVQRNAFAGTAGAVRDIGNALGYIGQMQAQTAMMQADPYLRMWGQDELADKNAAHVQNVRENGYQPLAQVLEGAGVSGAGNVDRDYREFIETAGADAQNGSKVLRVVSQTANGVGGMVPNILANAIVPGSGMWALAARAFGGATEKAIDAGASNENAVLYGGAVAAVEVLTEMMFDGIPGLRSNGENVLSVSKGVENIIGKYIKSEAAQTAILSVLNILGEGAEEFVAEFGDWGLNKLLVGDDNRTLSEVHKDAWYSAFIGALTSFVMSTPSAILNTMSAKQMADAVMQTEEMSRKYKPDYFDGMTEEEARAEFRRLSKEYHPDLHPNDANAAKYMAEITDAYNRYQNTQKATQTEQPAAQKTAQRATPALQQAATNNIYQQALDAAGGRPQGVNTQRSGLPKYQQVMQPTVDTQRAQVGAEMAQRVTAQQNAPAAQSAKTAPVAARSSATAEEGGFTGESGQRYTAQQAAALAAIPHDGIVNAGDFAADRPITASMLGMSKDSPEWQALENAGLVWEDDGTAVAPAIFDERARRGKSESHQVTVVANRGGVPQTTDAKTAPAETPANALPLEQRVAGDALYDAQDLIDTVRDVGAEVDDNGYVTVYHRTSPENAERIRQTGVMKAKEDGVFFSTKELGQNEGYGDAVVALRIPAEKLELDDIFDDEAHVKIPLGRQRQVNVAEYLVKPENAVYNAGNPVKEGTPNGREEIAGRGADAAGAGSLRNGVSRPGESVGEVPQGAGANREGYSSGGNASQTSGNQIASRSAKDPEVNKVQLGDTVSAADFNMRNPNAAQKVRLVKSGTTKHMDNATAMVKKASPMVGNMQVVFYGGGYLSAGGNDYIESVMQHTTNTMYLAYDDPHFTSDRYGGHELCHRLIRLGHVDVQQALDYAANNLPSGFVEDAKLIYAVLYPNSSDDQNTRELVCDAAGLMNRPRAYGWTGVDEYVNRIDDVLEAIHDYLNASTGDVFDAVPGLHDGEESNAQEPGENYDTNGGKPAPPDINPEFADAEYSVAPPYRPGTPALREFIDGLNKEARKTYDLFDTIHSIGWQNKVALAPGKTPVDLTQQYMTASKWNDLLKANKEAAGVAKELAAALPENIRTNAHVMADGTIRETPFEQEFRMERAFVQRVVDALPMETLPSTITSDGKEIRISNKDKVKSVGGDAYRRALVEERREMYRNGKLPTKSIGGLSKDSWGAMGFLATNGKTGASGDFTTFCPQMYFNKGCFYCYRRAALTTGVNNKLAGETVWYTGEILQLTQDDIDNLNENGGLRIQSFGDWMEQYSAQLADLLQDAETVGLQIKIITKEPSMIDTVAILKEQGLGKNLYFNLSADYTIEEQGAINNQSSTEAQPRNIARPYMHMDNGKTYWKRALTVEEANEYRKKYPWVNTRIVATTVDEFLEGLRSPVVDVVTGYHGNIRRFERVSSATGETLLEVEPLGDAGMPRFAFNEKTGKWTMEYDGKTATHKRLAKAIEDAGLQFQYYIKSCCITGRCATCKGKCGKLAKDFNVKNATNADKKSVAYWQKHMTSAEDNPLLLDQMEDEQAKALLDAELNRGDEEYSTAAMPPRASLTETQAKNYDHNQKQTEIGSTLRTLGKPGTKGSDIKRSKYGVGKDIGGTIYVHRDYVDDVIPADVYENALQVLSENHPDFEFNCVEWNPKTNMVRFDEAAGFDKEREPVVGDYIRVSADGKTEQGHTNYIWHHKWLWVKNDYKGFDVKKSWEWSKQWLSTISGKTYEVNGKPYTDNSVSDGNGIERWNAQLDAYGLPKDGKSAPIKQEHTSRGTSINTSKIPVLYTQAGKKGAFQPGGINIDIGAGVEGTPATAYLKNEYDVTSMPFDPFNRNRETNKKVVDFLKSGKKADTATCSNCLNVIDNADARANVILEMAKSIKPDGTAYFTVYSNKENLEAGKAGEVKAKPDQWQEFRDTKTYVPEIEQYFDDVTTKGGLIIAREPAEDLPKAVWQIASTAYTDKEGNHPYTEDEAEEYSTAPSIARLEEENERLRQRLAEARAETKVTKGWKADPQDVAKVSKSIAESANSKISQTVLQNRITKLVEDASNGQISDEEIAAEAGSIAQAVVEKSEALASKDLDSYSAANGYLKKVYISVPQELRDRFDDFKFFADTHKMLQMKHDGVPIKDVYAELQRDLGTDYFPDMPGEKQMLEQMGDVMESLTPVYGNQYSFAMQMVIEEMGNEILTAALDIGQKITYADRAQAKLQDAKKENKATVEKLKTAESYIRSLQRIATRRMEQNEALKQHYADTRKRQKEARDLRQSQDKLLRVLKRLNNRKLPMATKNEILDAQNAIAGVIDTIGKSFTGEIKAKRYADQGITDVGQLQDWVYRKTTEGVDPAVYDPNFIVDGATKRILDRLKMVSVKDLTAIQVKELTQALLNIEARIAADKKAVDSQLAMEFYQAGTQVMHDIDQAKPGHLQRKLRPLSAFLRMADYNDNSPIVVLYKEMLRGEEEADVYRREAIKPFSTLLSDHKWLKDMYGKSAKTIMLTGTDIDGHNVTVEITPMMRIALYLHSLNDDNFRHLYEGGIVVPDMKWYRKGDLTKAYNEGTTVHLSRPILQRLAEQMTPKERQFAKLLQNYYNDFAPKRMNPVSLALDGYEKFTVEDYYPLNTDRNFLNADYEAKLFAADASLARPGWGEERIKSKKPVVLYDANTTFLKMLAQNSMYAHQAIPLHNMNRLLNVQLVENRDSVKAAMNRQFPDGSADKYVSKFMSDYAGHRRSDNADVGRLLDKLRSNYSGGVLLMALSTAGVQAASYPTAAAVVSPVSLIKALNPTKINLDFIDKRTAIYTKRTEGLAMMEMAELREQGRHIPKVLNWIQGVDMATTSLLKRAAYWEIRDTRKDLHPGTEEFEKAVVDVYLRIIEETQPNYSAALRPDVLRSENAMERALIMFATQPLQQYNIAYDAVGRYESASRHYKTNKNEETKAAKNQAAKGMGRAFGVLLASSLAFALLRLGTDTLMGNYEKKYKPGEKSDDTEVEAFLRQFGMNMLGSITGMWPIGKTLVEFVEATTDTIATNLGGKAVFGKKWYGVETATVGAINDALDSFATAVNYVSRAIAGKSETKTAVKKVVATAEDIAVLFGIPAANVHKLVKAIAHWAGVEEDELYDLIK